MTGKVQDGGITTPAGFMASSINVDIKGKGINRDDCVLLVSDEPCTAAGIFTSNLVKAAPVIYDQAVLKSNHKIKAVVVNSGNANACTGAKGLEDCEKICEAFAKELKIKKENILTASTGVIGVRLPYEKIISSAYDLCNNLSDDKGHDFARGIMTTDTVSKEEAYCVETPFGIYSIGGCTKGAGMISPNLATMLTFISTDVKIEKSLLERALKETVEVSFNRISIDGDMSTNDSIIILANGMSSVSVTEDNYEDFKKCLEQVMLSLAMQIVMDGEGASKFVTIEVCNAKNNNEALLCASKIANSPLVKTMFAGCDPNWGRLMSSAGASGASFDPCKVDIYFNDLHYVRNGIIIDYKLEEQAYSIMKNNEYKITINLHAGNSSTKFYTCDFTADYIKINADYRS